MLVFLLTFVLESEDGRIRTFWLLPKGNAATATWRHVGSLQCIESKESPGKTHGKTIEATGL